MAPYSQPGHQRCHHLSKTDFKKPKEQGPMGICLSNKHLLLENDIIPAISLEFVMDSGPLFHTKGNKFIVLLCEIVLFFCPQSKYFWF